MDLDESTMSQKKAYQDRQILTVALPDRTGQIDPGWLENLLKSNKALAEYRPARRPTRSSWGDMLELAREIDAGSGLLFIRSGLLLPPNGLTRLTASLNHDVGLPRIPAGNYHDAINPLAGIPAPAVEETVDGWLWLCSEHVATPIHDFPTHCVYLPSGSLDKLTTESPGLLIDSLFAFDPGRPIDAGKLAQPAIISAFGPTRARLKALGDQPSAAPPPAVGLSEHAVTLHITHSWGGGVARWITDVIDADPAGHHLVLASHGDPNGVIHGETLRLYALGPDRGLVREIPLRPAIADSAISHAGYRHLLDKLLDRYAVSRILVSSLIGHSLDALNTGRPTALMLHDYYPAWPILHIDPLAWQQGSEIAVEAALTEHAGSIPFLARRSDHWRDLRNTWLQHVKTNRIVLFTPTRETLKRWQLLVSDPLETAVVIGHGFKGWSRRTRPVTGRARDDGRLNIVVPGRLSAGKGLRLLESTIDDLAKLAHLTLLGCGRNGWRFYGRTGVDIIAEYRRTQLPDLLHQLAPQAALFLSTVPETWNYALSETRALGIPPIATRLGSFIERIEPGKNGWLFDPSPDKLLDVIQELHRSPETLQQAAGKKPRQSRVKTVVKRYWKALPAETVSAPALKPSDPLQAEADFNSAKLARFEAQARALEVEIGSIRNELDARTHWALRCERLAADKTRWGQSLERDLSAERAHFKMLEDQLKERTQWAKSLERDLNLEREIVGTLEDQLKDRTDWAQELDQEIRVHRRHIKDLDRELEERTEWAKSLDQEISDHREYIADLESQLEERTQWAKSLEQDLVFAREHVNTIEAHLKDRTNWAQALDQEIAVQRRRIKDLNFQLEERTQWAKSLDQEISDHRKCIADLQSQLEDRTTWAKSLERDLESEREHVGTLEDQLKDRTEWAQALNEAVAAHRLHIKDLDRQLEERTERANSLDQEVRSQRQQIGTLESRLDEKDRFAQELETQLQHEAELREQADTEIKHLQQDLQAAESREAYFANELNTIRASRSWRLTKPLRFSNRVLAEIGKRRAWNPLRWPQLLGRLSHSLALHGLKDTLRIAQGTSLGAPEPPPLPRVEIPTELEHHEPVSLPQSEKPLASIIIPVYNNLAYTVACLRSIATVSANVAFEVIVVDDCSSDATPDYLATCSGIKVVRNAENSGFIATCNAGAQSARGDYLVFLNNDTTVTQGWLDALLETFNAFSSVGIVGARLVYPDGRLQEAGGIIFADASGWNYGRNESPDQPQYNFAAEADYVSGACLAISRALFAELGGFDRHFAPAYYEDTDLCFRVRKHGLKVICQPACTIIHHEGVSSGTDESSGTKRYQAVNREKFLERWKETLERQPPHQIDEDRPDPVRRARFHRARGRALVIDATTPMPDHDSGSVRFTAVLELMVEHGWLVSFMPQNLLWEGAYSTALQQRGIELLCAPAVTSLEPWLEANGDDLDLVFVSRHYILEPILGMLRRLCPNARIVFDTVDLHFLREQRQAELSGSAAMKAAAERTRKIELTLMENSDISLVVSPVEQQLLAELVPQADVRILSNIHTVQGRQQGWVQRRDVMFIGGFQHPPNVDAAEWLIDDIFPLIRAELPEVRLHIIGSRMPDALRSKAVDGVIMHGFVEDLTPYLNGCRLSLAPLRYGAGVKGKVNQAMAWGLPVVATRCASEGMFLEHGHDVLVADGAKAFADEVVRAYSDETLWLKLSEGGLANVERYFSRAAAGSMVAELLASTQDERTGS